MHCDSVAERAQLAVVDARVNAGAELAGGRHGGPVDLYDVAYRRARRVHVVREARIAPRLNGEGAVHWRRVGAAPLEFDAVVQGAFEESQLVLERLEVILARVLAGFGVLALNEAHVVSRLADEEIERGDDAVVVLLVHSLVLQLLALVVAGRSIGGGVFVAGRRGRQHAVGIDHAGASQNRDRVAALTHEHGALLWGVADLEVDAQCVRQGPPGESPGGAEAGRSKNALRHRIRFHRQDPIVHVERYCDVEAIVHEKAGVCLGGVEAELCQRNDHALVVYARPLRDAGDAIFQLAVQRGVVQRVQVIRLWVVAGREADDDAGDVDFVSVKGGRLVKLEKEQTLLHGPRHEHFERRRVHHWCGRRVVVAPRLEVVASRH